MRAGIPLSADEMRTASRLDRYRRYAPATLYGIYQDSEIVYVGATKEFANRALGHQRYTPWWTDNMMARPLAVGHHTHVLWLEQRLIKRLRPRFNRQGNPDWHTGRRVA